MDDLSENEIDAFDSRNERILLEQAGGYLGQKDQDADFSDDEEVMTLQHEHRPISEDEDEEEEDEGEEGEEEEDDEDEEGWGSKRNYYGGDDLSEDEDGMAEEALRQQKKHIQELQMDDYVDEDMMEDWKKQAQAHDSKEEAISMDAQEEHKSLDDLDDDEKLKHLQGSFPEFVPLLTEFNALHPQLETFRAQATSSELVKAKFVALSAYLGSITSYLAIFADKLKSREQFTMKENPVMESILSTREVWRQVRELNSDVPKTSADHVEASDEELEGEEEEEAGNMEDIASQGELQTDSEDESSGSESESDDQDEELDIDVSSKRTIKTPKAVVSGDYTETKTPDSVEKEDKERRKKSLRFYTSKIDQAAQKNAKNDKFDGDSDLPYRERHFERQQRLAEEARKRGLGLDKAQLGDSLDAQDIDESDHELAQQINDDAADYYESIKNAKASKKDARRAAHKLAKDAARDGRLAELSEVAGEDGKRALNFQILKNKGLTPHKRNENRNARVKKRKKYDKAQKKLKSIRQVYDDSNRGPYEGEKTGIKKNLSRSVRLI